MYDTPRHIVNGNHLVYCLHRNRLFRHAKDDATRFVLSEGISTRQAHLTQAKRAILAHPGQDYANSIGAGMFGGRSE